MKQDDVELAHYLAKYYDDPLGFVMAAFPWDTDKSLQVVKLQEPWASRYPDCQYGPDAWACQLLDDVGRLSKEKAFDGSKAVEATKVAVTSGHGIGKSALTAWLVCWIMSTRPNCQGTVTANTAAQLASKTWARISAWSKKMINAHWFNLSTGKGNMFMRCKFSPEDWFFTGITCRENESEAFAGQHAANSSSVYIFDEASAVPNKIWEVAEGGLTDGEPFWFVFGNPTRNSGRFYDCFHRERNRWLTYHIDSRDVQITNKEIMDDWKKTYGEDSDFFKVRVKGEFPSQSSAQLIPTAFVEDAMSRQPEGHDETADSVAIVGVDVARFGDDDSVICVRCGRDASAPFQTFHGLDGYQLGEQVARTIDDLRGRLGFSQVYVNIDSGGVGASPIDYLMHNGYGQDILAVNFGGKAGQDRKYVNKRAEMWGELRDWLSLPCCLPQDEELKEQLTAPEFFYDNAMRIQLEKKADLKARIGVSPDKADALALTFARRIFVPSPNRMRRIQETIDRTRKVNRWSSQGVQVTRKRW